MNILFNAAMRWELVPYQYNPMSLVRVKDSSKRLREPRFLTAHAQEFRALLEHIPEPFRTMCIVAMCLKNLQQRLENSARSEPVLVALFLQTSLDRRVRKANRRLSPR